MKIELDLSNRAELLRQQKEYRTALDIIDTALRSFKEEPAPVIAELFEPTPITTTRAPLFMSRVEGEAALYAKLPTTFTIKDVIAADPNMSRDQAKNFLKKYQKYGKLHVQERGGNGPTPNVYAKAV